MPHPFWTAKRTIPVVRRCASGEIAWGRRGYAGSGSSEQPKCPTASLALGPAPQKLRDGFELVRKAQVRTVRQLKPGASPREIFAAHNEFMTRHGAPPETRLHAHGQGCALVERPLIRSNETMRLEDECGGPSRPWDSHRICRDR
jgi:peptidase M24-like protein